MTVQPWAMDDPAGKTGDSRWEVPGSDGVAAFTLEMPDPSPIPVLIGVPHAGRCYPPSLTGFMRNPALTAQRLEDRYIDRVACKVAAETGAALLLAQAPRAMIDLNRAPDDMDWEMVRGGSLQPGSSVPSRRARSGLGLVPRRMPGLGELWNGRLRAEELERRMEQVHRPYHDALAASLSALRDRWGAALLLDLHSMPPLGRGEGGKAVVHYVLGDRFGASSDGQIVSAAFDYFAETRQKVAHNRPYAGGYVLDRHGRRAQGLHAIQLEVCRSLYLDRALAEPSARLAATSRIIAGLVRRLAAETAALGRSDPTLLAAE